jgi:PAS domain S-box-containing protein
VNAAVERQFGYPRAELLGQPVELLLPERLRGEHGVLRASYLAAPSARTMGTGRELFGRRKDGSEIPIEIGLNPLHTQAGTLVLATIVDISERKHAERERDELFTQLRTLNTALEERVRERTAALATTVREREVLLQEVHHRVKNNLQVISSLINMQLRKLPPSAAREALEECQARVLAIALIHEQLYQSNDYAQVQFAAYVRGLAAAVLRANGAASQPIDLVLAISEIPLPVDVAIPCGLVLVELVTNALKHAFRERQTGTVRVELVAEGPRLCLRVEDDGVGFPAGLDPAHATSMGLRLVSMLCTQLRGELVVTTSERGTLFQLTFPADHRA